MKIKNIISYLKKRDTLQRASDAWQRNEYKLAEELYNDVLKIDDNNFEASLWLGILLHQNKKYDQAIKHLEKAKSSRRKDYRAYFTLGLIFAERNISDLALSNFQNVLDKMKKSQVSNVDEYFNTKCDAYYNIALLHMNISEFGKAIDFANKALSIYPKHSEAEKLKMVAYQYLGK